MENPGLALIGFTVAFGAFYWAWRSQAHYWRKMANVYAVRKWPKSPNGQKHMEAVILFGSRWTWRSYAGITIVAVTDDGIWLKLYPPFSWLHKPIMLPFNDLKVMQTEWYLNSSSFELIASYVRDIRIVITGDLLDWISAHAPDWQVDTRRGW
jgi:hypothetical protein